MISHYKDTSNTYYYRPPTPASSVYTESVESNPKTGLIGKFGASKKFSKENSARVSSLFLLGPPVTYKSATSIANATSLTSIKEENEEKSGRFKVFSRVSSLILGSKSKSNVDLRKFSADFSLSDPFFQLKRETLYKTLWIRSCQNQNPVFQFHKALKRWTVKVGVRSF